MKNNLRPTGITTVLQTLGSGSHAALSTELEAYIADLEARQPDRPLRITEILGTIGTQYPADLQTTLATYISNLEATQQAVQSGTNQTLTRHVEQPSVEQVPIWSQQRTIQRERRRRERASQKITYYK